MKIYNLMGLRRISRTPNALGRGLCGLKRGLNERIDLRVLQRLGNIEIIED